MRTIQILSLSFVMLLACGVHLSHATISTIAYYQLGDHDSPAPVIGGNGDTTTVDTQGGPSLTRGGTTAPTYSGNIAAASSTVSMNFVAGYYHLGAPVTTATADIGFEMWVKPEASTSGYIFMNGNGYGGRGQYVHPVSGKWTFGEGGVQLLSDVGTATLDQWTHLAFVLDDSGIGHVYQNGVSIGNFTAASNAANLDFSIGRGYPPASADPESAFIGYIDEFKVFSFANFASFNPLTDLNLTVPEPSTVLLLSMGGWLVWRRTRKR